MSEYRKPKSKRQRINPVHRWSMVETTVLLQTVAEAVKEKPDSFEKPSAQIFYKKIHYKIPNILPQDWVLLRSKMRHLKATFTSALDYKETTGSRLLANGDESSVSAYVERICPYWDLLFKIFGQHKNVMPTAPLDSAKIVEFAVTPKSSPLSNTQDSFEDDEGADFSTPPRTQSPPRFQSPQISRKGSQLGQLRKPGKITPNRIEGLLSVQKKKLQLEEEKERNQYEIKKLELAIELERVRTNAELEKQKSEFLKLKAEAAERLQMERIRTEEKIAFEKLRLESDEKIALEKLRLESEEKIKIYKIDNNK